MAEFLTLAWTLGLSIKPKTPHPEGCTLWLNMFLAYSTGPGRSHVVETRAGKQRRRRKNRGRGKGKKTSFNDHGASLVSAMFCVAARVTGEQTRVQKPMSGGIRASRPYEPNSYVLNIHA